MFCFEISKVLTKMNCHVSGQRHICQHTKIKVLYFDWLGRVICQSSNPLQQLTDLDISPSGTYRMTAVLMARRCAA